MVSTIRYLSGSAGLIAWCNRYLTVNCMSWASCTSLTLHPPGCTVNWCQLSCTLSGSTDVAAWCTCIFQPAVPDEQAVLVQPFLGDGQQTDGIMYIIRVDWYCCMYVPASCIRWASCTCSALPQGWTTNWWYYVHYQGQLMLLYGVHVPAGCTRWASCTCSALPQGCTAVLWPWPTELPR